jgi:hypothetical protein
MTTDLTVGQKLTKNEIFKAIACREFDVKETIQTLKHFGGMEFWCWGANGFTNCAHKALQFKVTGLKHRGNVFIALNGLDLYDVVLTTSHGTIKCILTDIYFDDLFDIMHRHIEVSI